MAAERSLTPCRFHVYPPNPDRYFQCRVTAECRSALSPHVTTRPSRPVLAPSGDFPDPDAPRPAETERASMRSTTRIAFIDGIECRVTINRHTPSGIHHEAIEPSRLTMTRAGQRCGCGGRSRHMEEWRTRIASTRGNARECACASGGEPRRLPGCGSQQAGTGRGRLTDRRCGMHAGLLDEFPVERDSTKHVVHDVMRNDDDRIAAPDRRGLNARLRAGRGFALQRGGRSLATGCHAIAPQGKPPSSWGDYH